MNDYELMLIISLIVFLIITMMLIVSINLVDAKVDRLRNIVGDLSAEVNKQNAENLKHIAAIVDVLENIHKNL